MMKQVRPRWVLWILTAAGALLVLAACCNHAGPGPDDSTNTPPTAAFVDYTVSGAGTSAVDGDYQQNGINEGRPRYDRVGGGGYLYYITASDASETPFWVLHDVLGDQISIVQYYNGDGTALNAPESMWSVGNGNPDAPSVQRVAITGTLSVGQTLTGHYQFDDPDGDAEGASTYQWYRFANATDTTGGTALGTALTYQVVAADSTNFLRLEVTPVDDRGLAGTPVLSGAVAIP